MTARLTTLGLAAATVATMALPGCASTPPMALPTTEAVLLNAEAGPVRDAIRTFVRQNDGGAYIADPDSLATSPTLRLDVRERPDDRDGPVSLAPRPRYDLMIDTKGDCWLVRSAPGADARAAPIAEADCRAL